METAGKVEEAAGRSERDPRYSQLPGEFWDAKHNTLWNLWTTPDILRQCQEFSFRSDDVVLATYPKSGTTLVQEVLWLLHNNLDFDKSKLSPVYVRVPFLELHVYETMKEASNTSDHINLLREWPAHSGPRLIKTHLPYRYLANPLKETPGCRIINVMRNPKDTAVSYYHFYKGVDDYGPWQGEWNEFFEMWMTGHLVAGDWFDVQKEYWREAHQQPQRFLSLFYEDLLENPRREYARIAEFCGLPSLSEADMDRLVEHTSFGQMRANDATNYSTMPGINLQFMRKGQIGDWKNYFSEEQSRRFDQALQLQADELPKFRFD